jgi:acetylornithine/succinyldiaminopimelate/putrescine aminotransferase
MSSLTTDTAAGPEELLRLKREYLVPCVYHFYKNPPQIVAGEGCYLFDHAGRRYLDCYSGVTVMSAGHCVDGIIEPAIAQLRALQHTTSIYLTEPVLRLAEALATITPPGLKRSFFCASGTEAVEGALLLAALHTKRDVVIAMTNALHGRTRWAMNVTGLAMWRTDPFPMAGVIHVEFGNLAALEATLRNFAGRVAAVIGEPIQGNAGIVVPPADFWPGVRRLCDEHGALLVLDEIQTGFNRTGRWFACEHWGVRPDVMAISKAMGNGFPIAAFVTTDEIAASYTRPGASTYGGNPVSAAAALAVIDFHKRHGLGARAARTGELLRAKLTKVARRHASHLRPPHGTGLMIGMPVMSGDGAPSAERCDWYLERLKDAGMLAGKTGLNRNVLTFMPPLTMDDDDVEKLIHAMEACAE